MLFNSIEFGIFLPIVFFLYWFVVNKKVKWQNFLIVCSSYIFYGWWNWRFLFLILFSTVIDYVVGLGLAKYDKQSTRKALLWISIIVNLGMLGFFKYYNFFLDNFVASFTILGGKIQPSSLNIVLPVGISFYTFQTLSYSIDIYKRKLEPTKDFVAFAAFVGFFPQLVAGPIERATNLLPQFFVKRFFHYSKAVDGLRQILWGLFKKIVVADNCATFANQIFDSSYQYSGSTLVLGAIFFAFQIYGDFSGYSDVAIGVSRLFGFNLTQNFAFPYFSRDIAEFWRRWHISLSTWFRDYVYIPLGGSRGTPWTKIRNTITIFIISGFWHGASWNFIVWGALNGLYFLPLLLSNKHRINLNIVAEGKLLPTFRESISILFTFCLTTVAWIFFRAENLTIAIDYLAKICSPSIISIPEFSGMRAALVVVSIAIAFAIIEWIGRGQQYAIERLGINWPRLVRWGFYYFLSIITLIYSGQQEEFIYFQF